MSVLQEQAIRMVRGMSDENVSFLIEMIQRLMPHRAQAIEGSGFNPEAKQAFQRLEAARAEIGFYLPEGFDPDKELDEARAERHGSVG